MKDQDYCLLSRFSYQQLPDDLLAGDKLPLSVRTVCRVLATTAGIRPELVRAIKPVTLELAWSYDPIYKTVQDMWLIGGWQRNGGSGMCAFAFRASNERVVLAFRGSESDGAPTRVDWIDNFGAGITGVSAQYLDIDSFLDAFAEPGAAVTGHSKGGHNALYAAATDARVSEGYAFDGQGFAAGRLSVAQARKLRDQGIRNFVSETDLVGALLFHPERRTFVKLKPGTKSDMAESHRMENILFVDGHVVPGSQSIVTRAAGKASRWVSRWLLDKTKPDPTGVPAWVHAALLAAGTSLSAIAERFYMAGEAQPQTPVDGLDMPSNRQETG